MAEIKIDKGVPMPNQMQAGGKKPKYPWREMEIGDSFLMPPSVKCITQIVGSPNKRLAPLRFASRKTPEGYRVWRIA